jgi:DNA-binding Xre family transcriptional regulator
MVRILVCEVPQKIEVEGKKVNLICYGFHFEFHDKELDMHDICEVLECSPAEIVEIIEGVGLQVAEPPNDPLNFLDYYDAVKVRDEINFKWRDRLTNLEEEDVYELIG